VNINNNKKIIIFDYYTYYVYYIILKILNLNILRFDRIVSLERSWLLGSTKHILKTTGLIRVYDQCMDMDVCTMYVILA